MGHYEQRRVGCDVEWNSQGFLIEFKYTTSLFIEFEFFIFDFAVLSELILPILC